jgi:hypothetical protein
MVTEAIKNPVHAIAQYCAMMAEWVSAIRNHGDLRLVFPVGADATKENAELLE